MDCIIMCPVHDTGNGAIAQVMTFEPLPVNEGGVVGGGQQPGDCTTVVSHWLCGA